MENLSINQIEELQEPVKASLDFVKDYLKKHPISELEKEYLNLSEFASHTARDNFFDPNHAYARFVLPDIIAMEDFFKKHKDFIGHFNFMKKYRGHYYSNTFVGIMADIEMKFYQSKLVVPFIRVGIL